MQLVINVLNRDCCRRKRKICGTCDGSVNGILLMTTPCIQNEMMIFFFRKIVKRIDLQSSQ